MDGQQLGLIGGVAGSVIGVLGGLLGTYFSVRNTNGPNERAFVIRAAILCWLGVSAFLAVLFLLPFPWRALLWVVYGPLLVWFIRHTNESQAQAKVQDMADQ